MLKFTAEEIESGTGGIIAYGSKDTIFSSVSIDTRNLQGEEIFFAIRGLNQDGHRFIPDALSKGAGGAVAEQAYRFPGDFPEERVLIRVRDTHEALKNLALWARRRWTGTLVAITGSMGKTTTREFAAHVLKSGFRVYQTPGNYNNLFGLPLALFGLSPSQEVGIFEMGMSTPGEISEMCRIAAPLVGIITNVAPVHLQFFNTIEEIARAKEELAEALPSDGTLIYNADDPLVCDIAGRFQGQKISFGFCESADVRADHMEITGLNETRFRLSKGSESRQITIPVAGAHYVMNVLPAIALGGRLGIPLDQMIETFGTLQQASMRGQVLRFREGFTVIDDSYNSNPRALIKMIEVLSSTPAFTRRILVVGEMLELGTSSGSLHFECGTFAARSGVDLVIGIQGAAREIVRGAIESGIPASQTRFFDDSETATGFIREQLQGGDLVLIKGSRGVHLEKIVQRLRGEFTTLSKA
jgi:UDP-N-acetylmuramoyl-tripeptide--D-alanyl-D-alanine ligase